MLVFHFCEVRCNCGPWDFQCNTKRPNFVLELGTSSKAYPVTGSSHGHEIRRRLSDGCSLAERPGSLKRLGRFRIQGVPFKKTHSTKLLLQLCLGLSNSKPGYMNASSYHLIPHFPKLRCSAHPVRPWLARRLLQQMMSRKSWPLGGGNLAVDGST